MPRPTMTTVAIALLLSNGCADDPDPLEPTAIDVNRDRTETRTEEVECADGTMVDCDINGCSFGIGMWGDDVFDKQCDDHDRCYCCGSHGFGTSRRRDQCDHQLRKDIRNSVLSRDQWLTGSIGWAYYFGVTFGGYGKYGKKLIAINPEQCRCATYGLVTYTPMIAYEGEGPKYFVVSMGRYHDHDSQTEVEWGESPTIVEPVQVGSNEMGPVYMYRKHPLEQLYKCCGEEDEVLACEQRAETAIEECHMAAEEAVPLPDKDQYATVEAWEAAARDVYDQRQQSAADCLKAHFADPTRHSSCEDCLYPDNNDEMGDCENSEGREDPNAGPVEPYPYDSIQSLNIESAYLLDFAPVEIGECPTDVPFSDDAEPKIFCFPGEPCP